ncbi:MAG: hypothetical protein WBA16_06610 [Nonlabens sp.]
MRALLTFFIAILLISCEIEPLDPTLLDPDSGTESPPPSGTIDEDLIVGDWKYSAYDIDVITVVEVGSVPVTTASNTVIQNTSTATVSFTDNGNLTTDQVLDLLTSTTGLPAMPSSTDLSGGSGSYTITGNELMSDAFFPTAGGATIDPGDITFTIVTLNATTMFIDVQGTSVIQNMGVDVTFTLDGIVGLTRL